jgi:hypothetical protein
MTWDDIWADLQCVFAGVAADVKEGTTHVASACGRTRAAAFPFGAYLSFGLQDDASREDIVVAIDCKYDGKGLLLTCDIARGDGYVLVDGPTLAIAQLSASSAAVARWLVDVAAFLRAQVGLVKRELMPSVSKTE